MVALVATDVVFTKTPGTHVIGARNKRRLVGTLVFGDGSKTYPTNGIPITTPQNGQAALGLARHLDKLDIVDQIAGGVGNIYKWDSTNHTIRIFTASAEVTTSYAPAAGTSLTVAVEGS